MDGSELVERKAARLQRGGNTSQRREKGERKRGVERVWCWVCTRRKPLRPQPGELGELGGASFLQTLNIAQTLSFWKVCDFCGRVAVARAPGE